MHKTLIFLALLLPVSAAAQEQSVAVGVKDGGFEQGEPGSALTGWGGNMLPADQDTAGYRATIDPQSPAAGEASLRIESQGVLDAGKFGTITRALDVEALRGRKIRLTGKARVGSPTPKHAGFWLRVDLPSGQRGFFDNMRERPVISGEWQSYSIEADVAVDASRIVFGFLVQGEGTAWVDDFRIEDIGPIDAPDFETALQPPGPTRAGPIEGDLPPADITERGVDNLRAFARLYGLVRWFHPSDQAANVDWGRLLIGNIPAVEAAETSEDLAAVLDAAFRPVAPGLHIAVGESANAVLLPDSERHIGWAYVGFPNAGSRTYQAERRVFPASQAAAAFTEVLPGGVAISLPLSVPIDGEGKTLPASDAVELDSGKPDGWMPAGFDRTTRIAGMLSAWAMFDHFYPYWDVVDTDWDAMLAPMMREAALANDDIAHRDALLRLVEGLDDGHGGVNYRHEYHAVLPLDWKWIDGQLVITATSGDTPGIVRGMLVKAIDGVPVGTAMETEKTLVSGSHQWKTARAATALRSSHKLGERTLIVEDAAGEQSEVTLSLSRTDLDTLAREPLPDVVEEIAQGIVYVDIDRLTDAKFTAAETQIQAAKGLVFDMRGYPKGPFRYLSHLTDETFRSAEMNKAVQTKPDAEFDRWIEGGWTIEPALPRYTDHVVFITDGGAISWSESILGTVKANGIGTIIGTPTAGANGNVTTFRIPGGYEIRWTGMQVKNRDGTQHHIRGVQPDIPIEQTLAGVRAGRDELLDAALAEVKRQIASD